MTRRITAGLIIAATLSGHALGATRTPTVSAALTSTSARILSLSEADLLRLESEMARAARVAVAERDRARGDLVDIRAQQAATASAAAARAAADAAEHHDETAVSLPAWLLYAGIAVLAGLAGGAGALVCRASGCGR